MITRPKLTRPGCLGQPLGFGPRSLGRSLLGQDVSANHSDSAKAHSARPLGLGQSSFTKATRPGSFDQPVGLGQHDSAAHDDSASIFGGPFSLGQAYLAKVTQTSPLVLGHAYSAMVTSSSFGQPFGFGQLIQTTRMTRPDHSDRQSDLAIVLGLGHVLGLGTRTRTRHSDASYSILSPS